MVGTALSISTNISKKLTLFVASSYKSPAIIKNDRKNTLLTHKRSPSVIRNPVISSFHAANPLSNIHISQYVLFHPNLPDKANTNIFTKELGNTLFELSNRLSNVLTTIYDRKIAVDDGSENLYDHYFDGNGGFLGDDGKGE